MALIPREHSAVWECGECRKHVVEIVSLDSDADFQKQRNI